MAHFRNLSLHQKRWLECAASSISIELSPPILIQLPDRDNMCRINIYCRENELHRWISCPSIPKVKRKWGWTEKRETMLGQPLVTRAEPKKWPKWVRGWYGNICWRTLPRRHRERRTSSQMSLTREISDKTWIFSFGRPLLGSKWNSLPLTDTFSPLS